MFRWYLLLMVAVSAIEAENCPQKQQCLDHGGTCLHWKKAPKWSLAIMKGKKPLKCSKVCFCFKSMDCKVQECCHQLQNRTVPPPDTWPPQSATQYQLVNQSRAPDGGPWFCVYRTLEYDRTMPSPTLSSTNFTVEQGCGHDKWKRDYRCLDGDTKITLTWGHVFDLDLHVYGIPNNGNLPHHTYWMNLNGPGIFQDWDNIGFGPNGPETDTLTDQTINEKTVYAIGVRKYPNSGGRPDPDNTIFLNSAAIVSVTNGKQLGKFSFLTAPGHPVNTTDNWWFVGCVTVDSYDNFNLLTPPQEVFFDGTQPKEWTGLATKHCGAYNHLSTSLPPINLAVKTQEGD